MKLIVGLGNPGVKYEKTRHNLGFMVIDRFLKDFEPIAKTYWQDEKKFKSDIAELEWQPKAGELEKVILVKPKTYMNNSGLAVSLISQYFHILASDIWVVHDDIDLRIGALRIRCGGGSAGHKGIESIIESLRTGKFWRFRLGTEPTNIKYQSSRGGTNSSSRGGSSSGRKYQKEDVDEFVLGGFTHAEKGKVKDLIKRGSRAIQASLEEGLEAAMNRFNTK